MHLLLRSSLLPALLLSCFFLGESELLAKSGSPTDAAAELKRADSDDPREIRLAQRRGKRRRKGQRRRSKPAPSAESATPANDNTAPRKPAEGIDDGRTLKRGARVEFDGRLVQGQTARGALLLLARKRSELRSMVEERKSYRKEILLTVYPDYEDTAAARRKTQTPRQEGKKR